MVGPSDDYRSRVQEYKQRLENLLAEAQDALDRQAPDVLDKMAATARNIATRLDDMASDARQRVGKSEGTPESAGAVDRPTEPPDEPPASSGESSTAA